MKDKEKNPDIPNKVTSDSDDEDTHLESTHDFEEEDGSENPHEHDEK